MNIIKKISEIINEEEYIYQPPQKLYEILIERNRDEKAEAEAFYEALRQLEICKKLYYTKKGKIAPIKESDIVTGIFNSTAKQYGFVKIDDEYREKDSKSDLFIPPYSADMAIEGDWVAVKIKTAPDGRNEGEIVGVLKEGKREFCGSIIKEQNDLFFISDETNTLYAIKNYPKIDAVENDKVLVKVVSLGNKKTYGFVEIKENFGAARLLETNYKAILYTFGIKQDFDIEALKSAAEIHKKSEQGISESDLEGRADLRNSIVFTIDGADTKDIDDAISISNDESGNYVLGVHIADVSKYVLYNSPLDKEAVLRGTSVYFTDKVVPMLPKELSNGICSLNEGEDRLTLSAFVTIDKSGDYVAYSIERSVIRSVRKGVYSEINSLLSGEADEKIKEKYKEIQPQLNDMENCAKALNARRKRNGAVEMETTEVKIKLNEDGSPRDVNTVTRGESEKMIEEFMLAANETVAAYMTDAEMPCLYRVHEDPDEQKVIDFALLANSLGYNIKVGKNGISSKSFAGVIRKSVGTPHERVISNAVLRTFAKAKYSPVKRKHFGLSSKCYCHFTSPIRRYPDLFVHRVINEKIKHTLENNNIKRYNKLCPELAISTTNAEIKADKAERAIEKLYMTAYMEKRIGEAFDGVISGITQNGFFTELQNGIEGYVGVNTENFKDNFSLNAVKTALVGERTGREFKIGNTVRVKCIAADIVSSRIDFELIENL